MSPAPLRSVGSSRAAKGDESRVGLDQPLTLPDGWLARGDAALVGAAVAWVGRSL